MPNFHAKNIIWLKFTINYSLFKLNYNWRHCSAISLTLVMLCVCIKRVFVRNYELVCKAVRLAFSCQTRAISFPFIPITCWKSKFTFTRLDKWLSFLIKVFIFGPIFFEMCFFCELSGFPISNCLTYVWWGHCFDFHGIIILLVK